MSDDDQKISQQRRREILAETRATLERLRAKTNPELQLLPSIFRMLALCLRQQRGMIFDAIESALDQLVPGQRDVVMQTVARLRRECDDSLSSEIALELERVVWNSLANAYSRLDELVAPTERPRSRLN
jgi:hypothetical protein